MNGGGTVFGIGVVATALPSADWLTRDVSIAAYNAGAANTTPVYLGVNFYTGPAMPSGAAVLTTFPGNFTKDTVPS